MSKRPNSLYNRLKRERLHAEQMGRCFYCQRPVGIYSEKKGSVLEHHKPQSLGGTRAHLVLACYTCDRHKGMLDGHEFAAIIAACSTELPPQEKELMEIYRRAKTANILKQKAHTLTLPQQGQSLLDRERIDAVGLGDSAEPPRST